MGTKLKILGTPVLRPSPCVGRSLRFLCCMAALLSSQNLAAKTDAEAEELTFTTNMNAFSIANSRACGDMDTADALYNATLELYAAHPRISAALLGPNMRLLDAKIEIDLGYFRSRPDGPSCAAARNSAKQATRRTDQMIVKFATRKPR